MKRQKKQQIPKLSEAEKAKVLGDIATPNSAALAAMKLPIYIANNVIPRKRLKKGMPIKWRDKPSPVSLPPHGNNKTRKTGTFGTNL